MVSKVGMQQLQQQPSSAELGHKEHSTCHSSLASFASPTDSPHWRNTALPNALPLQVACAAAPSPSHAKVVRSKQCAQLGQ